MSIFEKKHPTEPSSFALDLPDVGKDTTYLGKNLKIEGSITGQDHIQLHGEYSGEMDMESGVFIEPTAIVRAHLKAKHITIGGDFDGDLTAEDRIEVLETATVRGNLTTPVISVRQGSVFEGNVQMKNMKPKE